MDKKNRKTLVIVGYAIFAMIVIGIIVARFCLGTVICVSGNSMYPSFKDGDFVAGKIIYDYSDIEVGDVVIVDTGDKYLIKRVYALPGQTTVKNPERGIPEVTLGEKEYYVLGDNWQVSLDSRRLGPIAEENIKFEFVGAHWTFGQMIVGVIIPAICLMISLTIVLIPANRKKAKVETAPATTEEAMTDVFGPNDKGNKAD